MSPRKLTESDKQEILKLYRLPQETTSTLAERYEVSSSTISRFLKSQLPGSEYEELIQQKRLSRTPTGAAQVLNEYAKKSQDVEQEAPEPLPAIAVEAEAPPPPVKRSRPLTSAPSPTPEEPTSTPKPRRLEREYYDVEEEDDDDSDVHVLEEMLGEDVDDFDEEELDDFDEDEDWEDEEDPFEAPVPRTQHVALNVQVLPFSKASLPRTCYLVVDRAAELITRPLKDFSDLGQIPTTEVQQKTLPVFDNHRVARRFSNRSQRVIKVPDGRMLEKVGNYLTAKGITRLLIDGQVYALS
jgi:transposase-like protein